jgi:hypothetical protein
MCCGSDSAVGRLQQRGLGPHREEALQRDRHRLQAHEADAAKMEEVVVLQAEARGGGECGEELIGEVDA